MLRRRRGTILLCGRGTLADETAAALARGRRRCVRVEAVGLERDPRLDKAAALILAGTRAFAAESGPGATDGLVGEPLARLRRRRPPRVILLTDGEDGEPPPGADGEAVPGLEHVHLPRRAARLLLARWPLHLGADPGYTAHQHLLIAGRSPVAEALLVHALRLSAYGAMPLTLTLIDAGAEAWRTAFERRHPQAGRIATLRFLSPEDPALTRGPPVSLGFVLSEPAAAALALAQRLSVRLATEQRVSPPLVLEVGAVEPAGERADWDGQLVPVAHRGAVLAPEVLLDGRGDALARVIHDHYRDTTEAQGRDPSQQAAGQPWPLLAESYRSANRHQADHLWAKLAMSDCCALPEEVVDTFAFAPAEVERLAAAEHERWAAERWLDGWRYAPVRDNARRHHPQLVPYAELSEPMKDLDRFAVRLVPALLARSGLGVVRMLIVALEPGLGAAGRAREAQGRALLARLCARYPGRRLMLASNLADGAARRLALLAAWRCGAGFFMLHDRPLGALLAGLDAGERDAALSLLARAERRIALPGAGELAAWIAARATIAVSASPPPPAPAAGGKRVVLGAGRSLHWNFEY